MTFLFGLLGVVGLILALFAAGAVAEHNGRKALKFGAAFVVCAIVIIAWGPKDRPTYRNDADCHIEWDGFSNPVVCN